MADRLAIISKAVFEVDSKGAAVGQVLPLDKYVSTNKALEPLRAGGRLFLVTVRPPDERLWLVAVLESPRHDGKAWVAKRNVRPIADVSHLRGSIRFTSNSGISATKGAMGMSLQTPRELTPADVGLLGGASSDAAPSKTVEPKAPAEKPAKEASVPPSKMVASKAPAEKPAKNRADVAAMLKTERWADALEALLKRWQDDRAPELAGLIEAVSSKLPTPKSWRLSAADAASTNLVAFLSTLTDGKFADSLQRIQQLEKLPADPRVASALTRLIVTPPFTAQSSREFWSSLYEQLGDRHADPRTLATVRPLVADYLSTFGATKMGEAMQRRAGALVATLTGRFPSTPAADVASLVALVPAEQAPAPKKTSKGGKTLEDLLAAVYENPDDDGVREVYADALLEQGDPRGEFIVLQFRRHRGETLTPAELKQEAALQKKHAKAWLGPLYDVLHTTHLEFRRGFLYGAQIRPVAKALPAARNHPAWSTLRELNMSTGGTNERGASLVIQPNARHVRVMTDVVYHVLDELAASTMDRVLEVLEIGWLPLGRQAEQGNPVPERAWAATLTGKAFPKLRELHLGYEAMYDPEALSGLWSSPLVRQLEAVRCSVYGLDKPDALKLLSRASKKLRVELDFGPVVLATNGDGGLAVSAKESRREVDQEWPRIVAALDPAIWKTVTVAPGALGDAQLSALAKRLPKATITAG
ncbi:MAG: TIGR02996 domain-containing protein [Myxococcales bacterium]|nr:TIGR02996 domain-containing protein [Myxococcales bacterium]